MPTSQRPDAIASMTALSLPIGGAARFSTQPFTTRSVSSSPRVAIIVATRLWL